MENSGNEEITKLKEILNEEVEMKKLDEARES